MLGYSAAVLVVALGYQTGRECLWSFLVLSLLFADLEQSYHVLDVDI